ncbi:hypothetical protein CPB84DRAFT_1669161 [Gymnopilus junonius]|uniref:t-SNARE coiled-coil homology domain-containing protein n=1 Tax=Gymnopilus junonius TaxID=109634 RepID=A0A9P5P1E2_GYMJU|nr:hypothetical protein CPB84DRAFT_1669161 [Gymnopilus junonius]
MPFREITNEFRKLVQEREIVFSEAKRRKVNRSRSSNDELSLDKTYIAEAYNILKHINTLAGMLASIRIAYLNLDSHRSPLSRQGSRNIDLSEDASSWSKIRHLTNEERDQIDLQARVILKRCSDRVKKMEAIEKRRAEMVANKTNPFTRLLPARLRQDESTLSSDVIAAHHSSITWYLSRRLTEASQTQKELQEERVKRQLERTRTLASSTGHEALRNSSSATTASGSNNKTPGSWLESTIAATIGVPSSQEPSRKVSSYTASESAYASEEDDDDDEIELSASQIMQFEAENANILKGVQDTLESVQQAEARLMDISALQMELVTHLTRQTELTDQLYEDALATTSTVEKGNEQLKEAKRRAKDGRIFVLVFLIGASLSLLFLHYY